MEKVLYNGKHKLFYDLKKVSELVVIKQDNGQEKEIYHHPYGITLDFYNYWNKDKGTKTILTCFGNKKTILKLEKDIKQSSLCLQKPKNLKKDIPGQGLQEGDIPLK